MSQSADAALLQIQSRNPESNPDSLERYPYIVSWLIWRYHFLGVIQIGRERFEDIIAVLLGQWQLPQKRPQRKK